MVPVKIHTQPKAGYWKSKGEGVFKAIVFKGKYNVLSKLDFLKGIVLGMGCKPENLLREGMDMFYNSAFI